MSPINLGDGPSLLEVTSKVAKGGVDNTSGEQKSVKGWIPTDVKGKGVTAVAKSKTPTIRVKPPSAAELPQTGKTSGKGEKTAPSKPTSKRSTIDVSPANEPDAKKARLEKEKEEEKEAVVEFAYSGEKDYMYQDRRACRNFLLGMTASVAPKQTGVDYIDQTFEFASQMVCRTGASLVKLYEDMIFKLDEAKGDNVEVSKLTRAVAKAKEAAKLERDRAKEVEGELKSVREDAEKFLAQFEEEKGAHVQTKKNVEMLKLENERLTKLLKTEQARLRNSRAESVAAERQVRNGLVRKCQAIFDKVKTFLFQKKEADDIICLYHQAKGVVDVLKTVKEAGDLAEVDKAIATYEALKVEYCAKAAAGHLDEVTEDELVVPMQVDDNPVINAYGSNEGLPTEGGPLVLRDDAASRSPARASDPPVLQ